jgi:hypothetical protein
VSRPTAVVGACLGSGRVAGDRVAGDRVAGRHRLRIGNAVGALANR